MFDIRNIGFTNCSDKFNILFTCFRLDCICYTIFLHPPRDEFPCRKDKGRHRGQRAYAPRHPTDRMVSNDSFLRPRPRLSLPCGAREEPPSRTRPGEHTPASAAGLRRVYTHPRALVPPPPLHVQRGTPLGNPLGPRRGAYGGPARYHGWQGRGAIR